MPLLRSVASAAANSFPIERGVSHAVNECRRALPPVARVLGFCHVGGCVLHVDVVMHVPVHHSIYYGSGLPFRFGVIALRLPDDLLPLRLDLERRATRR